MPGRKYLKKISFNKRLVKGALFFVLTILALMVSTFGAYSIINNDRIYANQYIGDIDVSKRSPVEAREILIKKTADFSEKEFVLQYRSDNEAKRYMIKPTELTLHYDIDASVDRAWQVGRQGGAWPSFWRQLRSLAVPTHHSAVYSLNEDELNNKIRTIAKEIDQLEKDFALLYSDGNFKLSTDRNAGKRIDQDEIKRNVKAQMSKLKVNEITFSSNSYQPKVSEDKARARLLEANRIIKVGNLTLEQENQQFVLDIDTIGGIIKSRVKDDDLELYFNDSRLEKFISSISDAINIEPQNAKLTIADGKATVFQNSQVGKTVDREKTKEEIKKALLARTVENNQIAPPQKIVVVVGTKKPEIIESDINNLGIIELVGSGVTSFKGSPANRIHNIQTGAAALNGILLASGETFSTLAKLGEISDKSGYLPELVIKEDKTIPEFGGGLCQVSTTLFRAALNAGTKIVERYNHRYRVGYYEPPVGMDATIYDPAPDFKFQNNYASHILIQSKVEGTKITFELYGTKDNRVVEIGTPEVYDYVDPEQRINIETDTLTPGEEKQIEKAHQGASAKFHYKITRDGQTLQETDFKSKYVPWPEKWLVGRVSTPPPEPQT